MQHLCTARSAIDIVQPLADQQKALGGGGGGQCGCDPHCEWPWCFIIERDGSSGWVSQGIRSPRIPPPPPATPPPLCCPRQCTHRWCGRSPPCSLGTHPQTGCHWYTAMTLHRGRWTAQRAPPHRRGEQNKRGRGDCSTNLQHIWFVCCSGLLVAVFPQITWLSTQFAVRGS